MNSRRFHQAWDEEIASWKMHNAGWRMQEAAVEDWQFRRHSEIFAMIANFRYDSEFSL